MVKPLDRAQYANHPRHEVPFLPSQDPAAPQFYSQVSSPVPSLVEALGAHSRTPDQDPAACQRFGQVGKVSSPVFSSPETPEAHAPKPSQDLVARQPSSQLSILVHSLREAHGAYALMPSQASKNYVPPTTAHRPEAKQLGHDGDARYSTSCAFCTRPKRIRIRS